MYFTQAKIFWNLSLRRGPVGNLSLNIAPRKLSSPLQDETHFQSNLSVRISLGPQKCVRIPQKAATDPWTALSFPRWRATKATATFSWHKPTKHTVPRFVRIMHVRKTFSAVKTLLCPYKSQEQINTSSDTPSANTTVLIQLHGIRTFHQLTSAVYIYSGSTHTDTHTRTGSHVRIVLDVSSMYGINQWDTCLSLS